MQAFVRYKFDYFLAFFSSDSAIKMRWATACRAVASAASFNAAARKAAASLSGCTPAAVSCKAPLCAAAKSLHGMIHNAAFHVIIDHTVRQ